MCFLSFLWWSFCWRKYSILFVAKAINELLDSIVIRGWLSSIAKLLITWQYTSQLTVISIRCSENTKTSIWWANLFMNKVKDSVVVYLCRKGELLWKDRSAIWQKIDICRHRRRRTGRDCCQTGYLYSFSHIFMIHFIISCMQRV